MPWGSRSTLMSVLDAEFARSFARKFLSLMKTKESAWLFLRKLLTVPKRLQTAVPYQQ